MIDISYDKDQRRRRREYNLAHDRRDRRRVEERRASQPSTSKNMDLVEITESFEIVEELAA